MNTEVLEDLVDGWREEAARFAHRGLEREARMAESYAADLEERLREWKLETLTLKEAAAELGVSYDTVARKIRTGEYPNAGRKNAPRVRREDLFRGSGRRRTVYEGRSRDEIAREVVGRT